ncbi:1893_t:CDS:10 [Entrophospora sp. SA101]|nr:1893_t:CDS:10 [Entrophospora sp. SA101]
MSSINDWCSQEYPEIGIIVTTSITTTSSSTTSLDLASSSLPPYPSKYVMSAIVPISERKEGEEGDQATGDNNSIVIDINNNYNNDSDVMSEIMSEINGEKYYNGIKVPPLVNEIFYRLMGSKDLKFGGRVINNIPTTSLTLDTSNSSSYTNHDVPWSAASLKIEQFENNNNNNSDEENKLETPIYADDLSRVPTFTPFSHNNGNSSDRHEQYSSDNNGSSDINLRNNRKNGSHSNNHYKVLPQTVSPKTSKLRKRNSIASDGLGGSGGGYKDGGNVTQDDNGTELPLVVGGGYVPATPKRNIEFHSLFRSVPEYDSLINDFGCALQREILVQGRLYVSCTHVCFNANIFGWITNLVIAFKDIVSIEKKMTAFVIPNAILISTLHAKNFFTSFLARDTAYELLYTMWKQSHPSLARSISINNNATSNNNNSTTHGTNNNSSRTSNSSRKNNHNHQQPPPLISRGLSISKSAVKKRRSPTQCACMKNNHFANLSFDGKLPGTVEKIYNLLFTSDFVERYLTYEEKCTEVHIGEWKSGYNGNLTRSTDYIKPLNNSLGPKSTKCIINDESLHRDFENYTTNLSITTTPDVPSGGSFCVKTKTCIMWAGQSETRIIVTCSVEWSKSSWLKGQQQHWKSLMHSAKKYISAHPTEFRDELVTSPIREKPGILLESEEICDERPSSLSRRRSKEPCKPLTITGDIDLHEQLPPTPGQRKAAGIISALSELPSIISSILGPLVQTIFSSPPSTNTLAVLVLVATLIINFSTYVIIRDLGYRELVSIFDDHFENDVDLLWKWMNEKSKRYDNLQQKDKDFYYQAKYSSPPLSSSTRHNPQPSSTQYNDNNNESDNTDDVKSNNEKEKSKSLITSQNLYEQIDDLDKLMNFAEGHVKKLVNVAEKGVGLELS